MHKDLKRAREYLGYARNHLDRIEEKLARGESDEISFHLHQSSAYAIGAVKLISPFGVAMIGDDFHDPEDLWEMANTPYPDITTV